MDSELERLFNKKKEVDKRASDLNNFSRELRHDIRELLITLFEWETDSISINKEITIRDGDVYRYKSGYKQNFSHIIDQKKEIIKEYRNICDYNERVDNLDNLLKLVSENEIIFQDLNGECDCPYTVQIEGRDNEYIHYEPFLNSEGLVRASRGDTLKIVRADSEEEAEQVGYVSGYNSLPISREDFNPSGYIDDLDDKDIIEAISEMEEAINSVEENIERVYLELEYINSFKKDNFRDELVSERL
jgi:hypothetical protein